MNSQPSFRRRRREGRPAKRSRGESNLPILIFFNTFAPLKMFVGIAIDIKLQTI